MKLAAFALLAVFVVLYPTTLSTRWQSVLFFPVGLYVLLALGLNIVVGYAGLLDLGYVAFYAVGAYTAAKLTVTSGWNAWEALPLAIVLAAVAGVVLGGPDAAPPRATTWPSSRSASARSCASWRRTARHSGEARGITGIPHPSDVLGIEFAFDPLPYYYLVLAAVVRGRDPHACACAGSRVGRAWAAIREDEDAAARWACTRSP